MSDYPLNEDGLTQTNQTVFDVAQPAVNLAVSVLNCSYFKSISIPDFVVEEALDIVAKYADWEHIDLPSSIKRKLVAKSCGEQE